MNIRNRRQIKEFAAGRLESVRNISRIILIYCALTLGLSALTTLVNYFLDAQMENLTGLSSIGKRTTLSSIQSVLPFAVSLFTMCVNTGYLAVMLRIARGQYVSEQTLRLGFDRFWVLMRTSIFMGLRYTILLFLCVYAGIVIFMTLPLAQPAMDILSPYIAQMSALSGQLVLDDAAYAQFAQAIWPAYVICGILYAVMAIPMWYSYRMVHYVIIDKPAMGALAAMRESKQMMRRNRFSLFRLDVSFWWFYLVQVLASVVCYADMILPMLGITLPGSAELWYFVCMGGYFAILFAANYFLRSRVEVSYALAYDCVKPEEKKDSGVVLGNIFQMQ